MKYKLALAAVAALVVGSATAAGTTYPGGSMGTLSPLPAQFGDLFGTGLPSVDFTDTFGFDLSAKSKVTGSVGSFFGSVTFSSVLIDGHLLSLTSIPTGYGFSLDNLGLGSHTLTVKGSYPTGGNAYVGSLYATAAVPEPESMVMALAGLGLMSAVALRRRSMRS